MTATLSEQQALVRANVARLCARFGDDYWLARDTDGAYPRAFVQALAADGWIGIAEAAVMMQAIAESGAGFSGASAVHINVFGPNVIVKHGSDAQRPSPIASAPIRMRSGLRLSRM